MCRARRISRLLRSVADWIDPPPPPSLPFTAEDLENAHTAIGRLMAEAFSDGMATGRGYADEDCSLGTDDDD